MSFMKPKLPTTPPAPSTPTNADFSVIKAGLSTFGTGTGSAPAMGGKLSTKAKTPKKSLIGGM